MQYTSSFFKVPNIPWCSRTGITMEGSRVRKKQDCVLRNKMGKAMEKVGGEKKKKERKK